MAVKPPRTTFLDSRLGSSCGRSGRSDQQREILREALSQAAGAWSEWEMRRLDFAWSTDCDRSGESHGDNLHTLTPGSAVPRRVTVTDHARLGSSLQGQEREFVVRCNC